MLILRNLLIALICLFILKIYAVEESTSVPLFSDNSIIEFTLEAPFESLFKNKKTPQYRIYTKAHLAIDGLNLDVLLRVRGSVRRSACEFPPLKLKITSLEKEQTVFKNAKAFKLVTHCEFFKHSEHEHEQLIIMEYLLYRFYKTLTPSSFHARLAKIKYLDSETLDKKTKFAFLIENNKQMATRNNAMLLKKHKMISAIDYDSIENSQLVRLFELYIGNGDYSLWGYQNIKFIKHTNQFFAVPYDFDRSAFVSMPFYPVYLDRFNEKIAELKYGLSPSGEIKFNKAISLMLKQKSQWGQLISELKVLDLKYRRAAMRRLNVFFKALAQM
ncbi:MAG: hypothetical protein HOO06_10360 [Bdellovibrionaceae bacterium]|jgi:hypothetical protein|nr:hypothetical protein [Pseudobdellovibrionaceae bacterium]